MSRRRRLETAMPWIVIGGVLLAWQAIVEVLDVRQFILPAPIAIWEAFLEYRQPIMDNALFTLVNTMSGFAIGIVVGLLLGIVIGSSRLAYAGLYPLLIGIQLGAEGGRLCQSSFFGWESGSRRRSRPRSCCRFSRLR